MNFCEKCGEELRNDSHFCSNCGAAIPVPAAPEPPKVAPEQDVSVEPPEAVPEQDVSVEPPDSNEKTADAEQAAPVWPVFEAPDLSKIDAKIDRNLEKKEKKLERRLQKRANKQKSVYPAGIVVFCIIVILLLAACCGMLVGMHFGPAGMFEGVENFIGGLFRG